MSRSHPGKPKPRQTRATAQIVCEGFTEVAFCQHLKTLYARDCGVLVTIHNARGGSPQDVVKAALQRRGYDRTFLFFDSDRTLPESWRKKSLAAEHQHVISSPCVETFLLSLLGQKAPAQTAACKKAFDAILPGNSKYDYRAYAKVFPPNLLELSAHFLLKTLLSAFQSVS